MDDSPMWCCFLLLSTWRRPGEGRVWSSTAVGLHRGALAVHCTKTKAHKKGTNLHLWTTLMMPLSINGGQEEAGTSGVGVSFLERQINGTPLWAIAKEKRILHQLTTLFAKTLPSL